jgi:cell division protein FtsZ
MEQLADGLLPLIVALAAIALVALVATEVPGRQRSGRVIRVVGVGAGGANTVETMIRQRMKGVEYVVVNTDVRALRRSSARRKVAIGKSIAGGRGAGGDPAVGEAAAREAADAIASALAGADLVVITAGLGGGTGSGAAPVIADIARQQGALTMAVVTTPFTFEGARRQHVAQGAVEALTARADAVATVPNDRAREITGADVTVEDAFRAVDELVRRNLGEIVDLIAVPGRINLDFADVRAVLKGGGAAAVGLGRASGDSRAIEATRNAMAAGGLDGRMQGAASIIVNVGGSRKLKLREIDDVARTVIAAAGRGANIVFGMSIDTRLRDEVQVTLIATGFGAANPPPQGRASKPSYLGDVEDPGLEDAEDAEDHPAPLASSSPAATPSPPAEWRPVWLRRADAAKQEPIAAQRSARRKRRAKHARQAPEPTPDVPFLSDG